MSEYKDHLNMLKNLVGDDPSRLSLADMIALLEQGDEYYWLQVAYIAIDRLKEVEINK